MPEANNSPRKPDTPPALDLYGDLVDDLLEMVDTTDIVYMGDYGTRRFMAEKIQEFIASRESAQARC